MEAWSFSATPSLSSQPSVTDATRYSALVVPVMDGSLESSAELGRLIDPVFTRLTERHVRGRSCWVKCWGATFGLLYVVVVVMTSLFWSDRGLCGRSWWCVTRMYICTFIAALVWVGYLWMSTTRESEVPLGLLVVVWFTSGTVSVGCCSLCNWAMVQLWAWMNPYCYITHPADNWPWDYTSGRCVLINMAQWILTAGIIEESFKFASLLRLRSTSAHVWKSIYRWRARGCPLWAIQHGWWLKVADSPLAVALCGVAAGGGLATSENFMYIFCQESIDKAFRENEFESAYGRIAASFAHMVWTGYAACGLARWQFLPPGDPARPRRKTSYLLAPIILHGLYNWCSTMQRCETHEEVYKGELYSSDGCYLPPRWRLFFRGGHALVTLLSFYLWHQEFAEIAEDGNEEHEGAPIMPVEDPFLTRRS